MSKKTVRIKNCFIVVSAFYIPLFASESKTPLLFAINLTWLLFLSCQMYFISNTINHPVIMQWMDNKTKIRDFIFKAFIGYVKSSMLFIPAIYLLLLTLGYEVNLSNQESLLQITMTLYFLFWNIWLLTSVFFVYKKSNQLAIRL
jgi:hypothetical protein